VTERQSIIAYIEKRAQSYRDKGGNTLQAALMDALASDLRSKLDKAGNA
jgi:hypothetical protein